MLPQPETAEMLPRTINLIVGLLRAYMGLQPDQVVVYNQKWRIPADDRLYLTVGYLAVKPYGNTLDLVPFTQGEGENAVNGLKEVSALASQETFSINVYSRSEAAIVRKDEVLLAFGSTQAAQLCDANGIKLARLPLGFTDLSSVEGAARLNRFVVTIVALCTRTQERVVQYFDKFQTTGLIVNP